jgi:hypothetical protein
MKDLFATLPIVVQSGIITNSGAKPMSILTRLFGQTDEAGRIRKAEKRIAVELEAVADDLAAHRNRRREVLGSPIVTGPAPKALIGKKNAKAS